LKHVERCRLLVHLIDVSGEKGFPYPAPDPIEAYRVVNEEMRQFSPALAEKPQIVVGNKVDLLTPEEVERVRARFREEAGVAEMLFISAATGQGVPELVRTMWRKLQELEAQAASEARLDLSEQDAVEYLQEQLERLGVFRELKRQGIQPGDRVILGTQEFEYQPSDSGATP